MKDRINSDFIIAMKEKNTLKKNLLSVIKGEIQTHEKNKMSDLSESEIISIINKQKKSIEINIASGKGDIKEFELELELVKSYLPAELSEEEITAKITSLIENGVNTIPMIMREFAKLPCDKKLVSNIAVKLLQ